MKHLKIFLTAMAALVLVAGCKSMPKSGPAKLTLNSAQLVAGLADIVVATARSKQEGVASPVAEEKVVSWPPVQGVVAGSPQLSAPRTCLLQ